MERTIAVNRITDEVKTAYAKELLNALKLGFEKREAANLAFSYIRNKFGIDSELAPQERGWLGRISLDVLKEFDRPLTKVCTICGKEKPLNQFSKNRTTPDKLQYQCKACDRMYQQKRAQRERQAILVDGLFAGKRVVTEKESYSFILTTNNVQVEYEDGQKLYSSIDGGKLTESDLEDIEFLRDSANKKIASKKEGN